MKWIYSFVLLANFYGCTSKRYLPTVTNIDINKYSGKWYEIARLPNFFEKDLECVSAEYTLLKDGKIKVLNKGRKENNINKISKAEGVAWIPNKENSGKLKVQFFWPFAGVYYISDLPSDMPADWKDVSFRNDAYPSFEVMRAANADSNYQYALVGDPYRKLLWILNRTTTIDSSTYNHLLKIASHNNFDTSKIIKVKQNCD